MFATTKRVLTTIFLILFSTLVAAFIAVNYFMGQAPTRNALPEAAKVWLDAGYSEQLRCFSDNGWEPEKGNWIKWLNNLESDISNIIMDSCRNVLSSVTRNADYLINREVAAAYIESLIEYSRCIQIHGFAVPSRPSNEVLIQAVLDQDDWLNHDSLSAWDLSAIDLRNRVTRRSNNWRGPCIYPLIWDFVAG